MGQGVPLPDHPSPHRDRITLQMGTSVTRFGEISPLWQNLKSIGLYFLRVDKHLATFRTDKDNF